MKARLRSKISYVPWVWAVGAFWLAMAAPFAQAEELFVFDDEATLRESMAVLGGHLSGDVNVPTPCRLDVINDLRGKALFDGSTIGAMNAALAAQVLGAKTADGCAIQSLQMSQEQANSFLVEQRVAGEAGLAIMLSYYRIGSGVSAIGSFRDETGRLISSTSGLIELQAALGAVPDNVAAIPPSSDQAAAPVAPVNEPTTAQEPAPATPVNGQLTEASFRREVVEKARIKTSPNIPFNLRRLQTGIPSAIKTVRIADASGRDVAMMTDLAEAFLDELAASPAASTETSNYIFDGQAGVEVTLAGAPSAEMANVDIQVTDVGGAFADVFANEVDVVVMREPISADDAERFAKAYGVNMRSRYAEYVIAIGTGDVAMPSCGIDYLQEDILMSMEDHPTSQRIYVYANPSVPSELRDRFIAFALSPLGQAAVADHSFDLRLQLSGVRYVIWRNEVAGTREPALPEALARFHSLIRASERVSTTFRFDFASADLVLDSRSEQDLENLIDLIKTDDIDSRRVLLFGFTDSIGAPGYNAALSFNRADAVANRLRLAGIFIPPSNVHGIGEDSPVACDLDPDGTRNERGARKNRRVEVWIES